MLVIAFAEASRKAGALLATARNPTGLDKRLARSGILASCLKSLAPHCMQSDTCTVGRDSKRTCVIILSSETKGGRGIQDAPYFPATVYEV